MLEIKTVRNPLVADEQKDCFCFRSSCSQTLSVAELASEMASYNSSFTEADNVGMLHVLNEVVVKFLAKGYDVELPFGIVRPTATGTCAGIQDSFVLGHGNNDVALGFSADAAAYKEVRAKLEYRQVNPDPSGEARLYRLNSKLADASESSVLEFPAGATVRLHGRNLSFDFSDERQGVFLENEGGVVRVAEFERAGSNIVDAVIPNGIAAGEYDVSVVTKPGLSYCTATIGSQITVTA
ncbi:MAG: DUF4469 domain-containing protein [Treponemataceae bacterium]|nr:DUF4469 domain-containing protein [Treponemataceae bacterium]